MAIPGGGEEAASQYLLGQAGRGRGTLVGRGQGAGGWPRGLSGGRCGKSAHACVRAEALKTRGSTVHRQVKRRKCRSDLMGQPGYRLIEPMAAAVLLGHGGRCGTGRPLEHEPPAAGDSAQACPPANLSLGPPLPPPCCLQACPPPNECRNPLTHLTPQRLAQPGTQRNRRKHTPGPTPTRLGILRRAAGADCCFPGTHKHPWKACVSASI